MKQIRSTGVCPQCNGVCPHIFGVCPQSPNHLSPAFGTMQDHRTVKFTRQFELGKKEFPHLDRYLLIFQSIQANFANSDIRSLTQEGS